MASPQLSFRVSKETYKTLIKLAELEGKTVTEMSKELIEQGLGKRATIEDDLLAELRLTRMELGDLMARAVKIGGITSYYARMSTIYTAETQHYTTSNGQAMPAETKKQRAKEWREEARKQAMNLLEAKFEEI